MRTRVESMGILTCMPIFGIALALTSHVHAVGSSERPHHSLILTRTSCLRGLVARMASWFDFRNTTQPTTANWRLIRLLPIRATLGCTPGLGWRRIGHCSRPRMQMHQLETTRQNHAMNRTSLRRPDSARDLMSSCFRSSTFFLWSACRLSPSFCSKR